jgi:hypothetical protein
MKRWLAFVINGGLTMGLLLMGCSDDRSAHSTPYLGDCSTQVARCESNICEPAESQCANQAYGAWFACFNQCFYGPAIQDCMNACGAAYKASYQGCQAAYDACDQECYQLCEPV